MVGSRIYSRMCRLVHTGHLREKSIQMRPEPEAENPQTRSIYPDIEFLRIGWFQVRAMTRYKDTLYMAHGPSRSAAYGRLIAYMKHEGVLSR